MYNLTELRDMLLERPALGVYPTDKPQACAQVITGIGGVSGRKVAIIDPNTQTIEALVVKEYVSGGPNLWAVAQPMSHVIEWPNTGKLKVTQQPGYKAEVPSGLYVPSNSERRIVGITEQERRTLLQAYAMQQNIGLKTRSEMSRQPFLPPLHW
ncbi:hypothetical protein HYU18_02965 [Candidatus Woesearchaeota archaeon]|nr:hypothetical protein [Candidatus Woesearchaeota archaeon]